MLTRRTLPLIGILFILSFTTLSRFISEVRDVAVVGIFGSGLLAGAAIVLLIRIFRERSVRSGT
jgi:hypothetical protein